MVFQMSRTMTIDKRTGKVRRKHMMTAGQKSALRMARMKAHTNTANTSRLRSLAKAMRTGRTGKK